MAYRQAARKTVMPSYLQHCMVQSQPMPTVAMAPLTVGQNDDEEESRKLRFGEGLLAATRRCGADKTGVKS